ncbi:hypothetical protein [Actinomadura chokoriensis]|uniref:Uncharacterized protein n=1 Tax=Actinomadura chokoriensis TaxID=454156 RepID=A0ABV4QQP2_9ACTN
MTVEGSTIFGAGIGHAPVSGELRPVTDGFSLVAQRAALALKVVKRASKGMLGAVRHKRMMSSMSGPIMAAAGSEMVL